MNPRADYRLAPALTDVTVTNPEGTGLFEPETMRKIAQIKYGGHVTLLGYYYGWADVSIQGTRLTGIVFPGDLSISAKSSVVHIRR